VLNQIDLSRADLNLLVLFEAVSEERHVRRAAERLHLSPSAISHGLGRLRRLLGDPLFLRTPRGVVPTERAQQLAAPITEILARVRNVIESAAPFDPRRSDRRFTVGAPDGVAAVFLPPLLASLRRAAPGIGLSVRQLLPRQGEPSPALAWADTLGALDAGAMDVAIVPFLDVPARFEAFAFYEEDFVVAMRATHPFAKARSLRGFCAAQHLVVSHAGDAWGFVDAALQQRNMARRVAVTVPNFMFALATLAESDLLAALPRRFVALHGGRFGIRGVEPPLELPRFPLRLVTSKAALADAGVSWLVERLRETVSPPRRRRGS
jgi:DNA-binding transcriptional LysR family regulator